MGIQASRLSSVREQFLRAFQLGADRDGRVRSNRYIGMRMVALTGYKITDRIVVTRKVMDPLQNRFFVNPGCVNVIERLMNYRWSQTADGINRETPLHDFASHAADAVGYGVLYFERQRGITLKPDLYNERRFTKINLKALGRGMKVGM